MDKICFLTFTLLFLTNVNGKQVFVDWNSSFTNSTCGSSTDEACNTIQKGLNNAVNGDVISLAAGTYTGLSNTQLTIPSGLSAFEISPVEVDTSVTIDFQHVQSTAPFLTIRNMSSLTLESINYVNANSSSSIITIYNSTLIITNCAFTNNKLSSALMADGSYVDITIADTIFQNNYGISGGAINIQRSGKLTLQNVQFRSNYAINGGAIYSSSSVNITADNIIADSNMAGNQGGFLYATDGRTTITSATLSKQFSDGSAGVVFLYGGRLTANNVQFLNNTAEGFGGAIQNDAGYIQVSNSIFSRNQGLLGGAAVYAAGSAGGSLDHCSFSDNWGSKGGAFGVFTNSRLTVSWSQLTDNSAEFGGAAYLYSDSFLTMVNCTVEENVATAYGGGIYCSDSTLNLTCCTLTQNTATLDDNTETGSSEDLFCSASPPYTKCNVVGDKPWAGQCQPGKSDNTNSSGNQGILVTAIILPIIGAVVCCGCVGVMYIQHRRGNKVPGKWIWKQLDSEPKDDEDQVPLGEATD